MIDNCSTELHTQLTAELKATHSQLSLLTIEYDIRKDLPSGTAAFLLEPGSERAVATVIHRR